MAALRRRGGIECARDGLRAITLDDVADLEVVEVLDAKTALESFAHFANVVFEPLERRERAVEDLDAISHDAHASLTIDHAAADRTTGDRADARNLEYLA